MIEHSLQIDFADDRGLQEQLREALVSSILASRFLPEEALPSCRNLSEQLRISRNTVALVYESLRDDGYLVSRPRSGYYVDPRYHPQVCEKEAPVIVHQDAATNAPEWCELFNICPSDYLTITKPAQWMKYDYPFIYGQPDAELFPMEQWREASRKVMGGMRDHHWLHDLVDQDSPMLIEQLRTRVLPKRGIMANSDEILLTLGTQNALSLLSQLLFKAGTKVGVESPVFREAINTFTLQNAHIVPHQIDAEGLALTDESAQCRYFYVTPSHQAPTGIGMSNARRQQLLQHAIAHNQIIIEDDFDSDTNIEPHPRAALKANDTCGRVVYISSLSKALSPGLRLGYLVGSADLIDELRALRRLMYRHPPSYIQYQMAYFLAQGHYETYLRRYRENSAYRWSLLKDALDKYLPQCRYNSTRATAFWVEAPKEINTQRLAWRAAHSSVLIEPGVNHFLEENAPQNFFRLGFNAIRPEAIKPGIIKLAEALEKEMICSKQR